MKYFISTQLRVGLLLLCLLCLTNRAKAYTEPKPILEADPISHLIQETNRVLQETHQDYYSKVGCKQEELDQLNNQIMLSKAGAGATNYVHLLEEKIRVQEEIQGLDSDYSLSILKTRYSKGLELIKLLYEKVLSLDHHFTSMQSVHHISSLSNPNNFPDFQKNRDLLESRLKKKSGLKMPDVLQSNIYLSATFSLVSALFGDGENSQKEKDLEKIACILDFTIRMNNDLNTIFYETEFLRQNNDELKKTCLELFEDYTRPIGYKVSLEKCRKEDDWEAVKDALDKNFKEMGELDSDPSRSKESLKRQINFGFSIDRLMDFMEKYSNFVNSGEKYYQKFAVIVSNYENEKVCAAELPRQYGDLKKDIQISIDKFTNSYRLSEIKGSKLKELLYGLPD